MKDITVSDLDKLKISDPAPHATKPTVPNGLSGTFTIGYSMALSYEQLKEENERLRLGQEYLRTEKKELEERLEVAEMIAGGEITEQEWKSQAEINRLSVFEHELERLRALYNLPDHMTEAAVVDFVHGYQQEWFRHVCEVNDYALKLQNRIAHLEAHRDALHETTNRYLERARSAEHINGIYEDTYGIGE